jgi:Uma2 family endonuclease
MAKNPTPTRWTYAGFAKLPEGDGNRYEVIAGEPYVTPAPRPLHQRIAANVTIAPGSHVQLHGTGQLYIGPIDLLFAEGDYLEPDLVVVRAGRAGVVSSRGIEAAPDLVVEVLSPTTAKRDRTLERDRYFHVGVPEYWIVDPDAREVTVYRADQGPGSPRILRDKMIWRVSAETPPCEIDLQDIFGTE